MKKILICLMSLIQVFAISASEERFIINPFVPAVNSKKNQSNVQPFSPVKSGKTKGFRISYVVPSPTDVTQVATPTKVAGESLKNIMFKKTKSVHVSQQNQQVFVEPAQEKNIDTLIALAFKHEESIAKRQMTRVSRSVADIEGNL